MIGPLAVLALAAAATPCFAGRPLVLDDAGINSKGEGHLETWVTRTDGATAFSLSPAYAFWDRVELAALVSRDNGNSITTTALQAKWMITPSQDKGCNAATSLGALHVKTDFGSGDGDGDGDGSFINGLFSCNGNAFGNVHFNLGYSKPSGASGKTNYGVALEKSFGAVTPHIEAFGSESLDTSVNAGLRGDIAKNVQLDGSVGRSDSTTFYTLGLKFRF